jgi:hypothetical protein
VCGVELFIDIEPVTEGQPGDERNQQKEDGNPEVNVKNPVKRLLGIQLGAGLIGRHKGQRGKEGIGEAKDGLYFSIVAAEHYRKQSLA